MRVTIRWESEELIGSRGFKQYIEPTEKRVLATSWVESILDPFEQIEGKFAEEEIKSL